MLDYQFNDFLDQALAMPLSPAFICTRYIKMCDFNYLQEDEDRAFIQKMLDSKPQNIRDNQYLNKLYQEVEKNHQNRKTLKIV